MKWLTLAAATACVLSSSAAYADVQITINNGLVSVVAKDATVRQILTEWARVGQTKIVNVEKIPGAPISVELTNVPEGRALDILLRSVSGYMAAPRATLASNLSRFDRIVVMPTAAAPRAPSAPAAQQTPAFGPGSQFGQPGFTPPQFAQPLADDDIDDDRAQPNVPVPNNGRPPVFNSFPQPQIINPATGQPIALPQGFPIQPNGQQQAPPTAAPTSPFGGVAVPGMMVPAPQQQQPGQIGVPMQPPNPNQPRRPGGPDGDDRDPSDRN